MEQKMVSNWACLSTFLTFFITAVAVSAAPSPKTRRWALRRLKLDGISPPLPGHFVNQFKQERFPKLYPVKKCRPLIADVAPHFAYPGSLIVILGHNICPRRDKNELTVGGQRAIVVTAEPHRLVAISSLTSGAGPIEACTN